MALSARDRFTEAEQSLRDQVIGRAAERMLPCWVHPVHITLFRIALFLVAVGMNILGWSLTVQVATLAVSASLDAVDGPLARRRGQVSVLGATMDVVGDTALYAWLGCLVLVRGLLSWQLVTLMGLPQLVALGCSDKLWRRLPNGRKRLCLNLPKRSEDFRPLAIARAQGPLILVGFGCLLLGRSLGRPRCLGAGYWFLYADIACAWVVALRALRRPAA